MQGRTHFSEEELGPLEVTTREQAERDDIAFWQSLTPTQRIAQLEEMRRIAYGPRTDPAILGDLEVVQLPKRSVPPT
jgi:hypothetical protein